MRRTLQLNPKGEECQRTSSSLVKRKMRWNMSFQKLSHGGNQLNCQVHQRFFMHLAPIPKQMILARKLFYQQENHGCSILRGAASPPACTREAASPPACTRENKFSLSHIIR
ncbi:hypothetical protein AMECASPLE_034159 [Ameca splendens]|uniref:Uncharacterized protein n=1 Tax=Ameca splendens TaxID=208324 RepID=A0ABV0Z6P1_9TELE